jgi:hypothetical protein
MTPANDNRPRLVSKKQAAAYCGACTATFGKWVLAGVMPAPVSITRMWDRVAIDAALDRASGIGAEAPADSFDTWKRGRDARKSAGR